MWRPSHHVPASLRVWAEAEMLYSTAIRATTTGTLATPAISWALEQSSSSWLSPTPSVPWGTSGHTFTLGTGNWALKYRNVNIWWSHCMICSHDSNNNLSLTQLILSSFTTTGKNNGNIFSSVVFYLYFFLIRWTLNFILNCFLIADQDHVICRSEESFLISVRI